MLPFLLYLCLLIFLLCGVVLVIMTLPGLWLMLAAAAMYGWLTHWTYLGAKTLVVLLVLALAGEAIETFSAGAGAKRAGGTRRGFWGALIGGILGGIFLTFVPIIGTLIGVCIGTFLGATAAEILGGQEALQSARIGFGAAKGRLLGTLAKLTLGCVMVVIALGAGLPLGKHKAPAAPRSPTSLATKPGA